MDISATSRYIRVSPRKMQLLARSISKLSPAVALTTLGFLNKSGSLPLSKVIASAVANAKQQNLTVDLLKFKEVQVLSGSAMKRFRAVSRGSAHSYKKRMSHVKVILTETKKKTEVVPVKEEGKVNS